MKLALVLAATAMLVAIPFAQAADMKKMDGKVGKIDMEKHRIYMMNKDNKEQVLDFNEMCAEGATLSEDQKAIAKTTCGMFGTMKEGDDLSVTYTEAINHGDPDRGGSIEAHKN